MNDAVDAFTEVGTAGLLAKGLTDVFKRAVPTANATVIVLFAFVVSVVVNFLFLLAETGDPLNVQLAAQTLIRGLFSAIAAVATTELHNAARPAPVYVELADDDRTDD
jgi:hypothetical protein